MAGAPSGASAPEHPAARTAADVRAAAPAFDVLATACRWGPGPVGGISGGGTGLMSGGGLSMGSGGPGTGALVDHTLPHLQQCLYHHVRPMARISASALLCSTTPGASGSRTPSAVLEPVLEVHVGGGREPGDQVGQRQIVRRHEADRALPDEGADDRLRADPAIVGIGAVQDLVEQKQQRHRPAREIDDRPDAENLGVEARMPRLQRVLHPQRRAHHQPRDAQRPRARRTGAPASASTTLMPTVRSSVLLPDMFEPLTMITAARTRPDHVVFAPTPCPGSADDRATARRRRDRPPPAWETDPRGARSGRSRAPPAPPSSPTTRSHSETERPQRACQRSMATASCERRSSAAAIGPTSWLRDASSHDTRRRRSAMRRDGGRPPALSDACSAASRGVVNVSCSIRSSTPDRSARSRSGVAIAAMTRWTGAARSRRPRSAKNHATSHRPANRSS